MQRSFFAVALTLGLGLACSRTDKLGATAAAQTPPAPAAAAPKKALPAPTTPAAERELAERFFNETISRHGGYLAMASNAGSQRSSLRRFELGLEVFQAKLRCPEAPDSAGLELLLRTMTMKLGLPVAALTLTEQPSTRRKFPAEVPDGTRLELKADDVRGVLAISMTLRAAPTDELVRNFVTETTKLKRLVLWTKAERVDDAGAPALRLSGESYWFYADVVVSKVVHKPPAFDDELAKLGASPSPTDDAARSFVERTRKLFGEMAARRNDYEQVLALIRQTMLKNALFSFVRERRALQDISVEKLKL